MKKLDVLGPVAFWRKKQINEVEKSSLEKYISAALHPIEPRPSFVAGLKDRLIMAPADQENNNEVAQFAILGLAGVLSGLIIFITGVRATVAILGALGLLRQSKNPVDQKQTALVS